MTFQSLVSQVQHPIFSAEFPALTSYRDLRQQKQKKGEMLLNGSMTKDVEKLNDIPFKATIWHNFI
jgi:hypothetical protein